MAGESVSNSTKKSNTIKVGADFEREMVNPEINAGHFLGAINGDNIACSKGMENIDSLNDESTEVSAMEGFGVLKD